jgi:hypothetical protein
VRAARFWTGGWLLVAGVLAAVSCSGSAASAAEADAGFTPIFNGTSLEGWEGKDFWTVKDGAIVGTTTAEKPTNGNTFLVWRQGTLDDFELKLEYKIEGGNSGIQYRSHDHGDFVVGGYQADIDSGPTYSGINYEERGRGILAERGQRVTIAPDGTKKVEEIGNKEELQKVIKQGDWNDYHLVAKGPKLSHFINGTLMSETIDEQEGKRAEKGVLALQLHAGPPMVVQFKEIHLKRTKLADGRKKLVLVAGNASHGPGEHEFRAGVKLLEKCLDASGGKVVTAAYDHGWPADPTAFDNADGIFCHGDHVVECRGLRSMSSTTCAFYQECTGFGLQALCKQDVRDAGLPHHGAPEPYDGEHHWQIDDYCVYILGPVKIDLVNEEVYNEVVEENVQPKVINPKTSWPFSPEFPDES